MEDSIHSNNNVCFRKDTYKFTMLTLLYRLAVGYVRYSECTVAHDCSPSLLEVTNVTIQKLAFHVHNKCVVILNKYRVKSTHT